MPGPFFCFCLSQLDPIARTVAAYYNRHRPHQGLGNVPPDARGDPPSPVAGDEPGPIVSQDRLGRLLRPYSRKAA